MTLTVSRKGRLVLGRGASSLPMSLPLLSCISSRKAASHPDTCMAGDGTHCRVKGGVRWEVSLMRVPRVLAVLWLFTKFMDPWWDYFCCLLLTSEGGQGMGCQGCEAAELKCALRMFTWPKEYGDSTVLTGLACHSALPLSPTLWLAPTTKLWVVWRLMKENVVVNIVNLRRSRIPWSQTAGPVCEEFSRLG